MRALILALLLSSSFLTLLLWNIRRQHLREQAALLWLGVAGAMFVVSVTLPLHLLDRVARLTGIKYPPDLILLLAVVFLVLLMLQLSVSVARVAAKQTVLIQELGLLAHRPAVPTEPPAVQRPEDA